MPTCPFDGRDFPEYSRFDLVRCEFLQSFLPLCPENTTAFSPLPRRAATVGVCNKERRGLAPSTLPAASEREERARAAEQARAKLEEVARRRLAQAGRNGTPGSPVGHKGVDHQALFLKAKILKNVLRGFKAVLKDF